MNSKPRLQFHDMADAMQKLERADSKAEPQRPRCAVRGMIRPGAMCGRVIVGGELCGAPAGSCRHQVNA